jgi:hypothetical protein
MIKVLGWEQGKTSSISGQESDRSGHGSTGRVKHIPIASYNLGMLWFNVSHELSQGDLP